MTSQSHTRRTVLASGAAVAGGAALAACGGGDSTSGGDTGGAAKPNPPAGEPLAKLADVPVGDSKAVTTPDGAEAIVSRKSETAVSGFSATCTHQGCTVAPAGAELKCPCHGSVFDAFTGEVKNGPAEQPLPKIAVRIDQDSIVAG